MIILNNSMSKAVKVNIFGYGETFCQLEPLLKKDNISIDQIFDDTKQELLFDNLIYSTKVYKEMLYCVGYKDMKKRYVRYKELKKSGVKFVSYVSPTTILSDVTKVGNGSIINQGAIIDNYVNISECVFVNIGATISHHSVIMDNVFIAPGANVAGYVTVEEGVFIGTNATIIDHIRVGKHSIVAAGAVVIDDVPDYSMVAGNPAVLKRSYL